MSTFTAQPATITNTAQLNAKITRAELAHARNQLSTPNANAEVRAELAEARTALASPGNIDLRERVRTTVAPDVMRQALASMGLTASLPPADQAVVDRLSSQTIAQLHLVAETAAGLNAPGANGSQSSVQAPWASAVSGSGLTDTADINSLVQWVLREAYLSNCEDMYYYAQKVRFYNGLKKQIREEATKARELLAMQAGRDEADLLVYERVAEDGTVTNFDEERSPFHGQDFIEEPVLNEETGKWEVAEPVAKETALTDKESLVQYITDLEEQLSSVGDDAQLANVDLQNMLQKQQQTLQMMSNISKMLHDTAMAIIRKIGS